MARPSEKSKHEDGNGGSAQHRGFEATLWATAEQAVLDSTMIAIERDNPSLKGVLPKEYPRPHLDTATRGIANPESEATWRDYCEAQDHQILGGVIDLVSTSGLGDKESRSKDIIGRGYDYSLSEPSGANSTTGTPARRASASDSASQFASAKGKKGDTNCEWHVTNSERRSTTSEFASIRKSRFDIRTLPDRLLEGACWKFGVPPAGNANYAWVQHFIHHLAPTGMAGFILANGSMSSNQSGEGETCEIALTRLSVAV